jgi:signal transduction histidine kinase
LFLVQNLPDAEVDAWPASLCLNASDMSLRWKMATQIACMLVGLLLVSAAAMWGLNGLHQDYGLALASNQELREVYGEVGSHLVTARELLNVSPADRSRAADQVELAAQKFDLFQSESHSGGDEARDQQAELEVHAVLARAARQLQSPPELKVDEDTPRADMKAVEDALLQLRSFATQIRHAIEMRQAAAGEKRRDTIAAVGVLCGIVIFGAIVLGILQYRSVMLPLQRLGGGVRKIAAGEFQQRLAERGSPEFTELANEFNRMAAELDEFYHRLEQKVADKSRELIRSERLASVGYLAAGVAHEINNPLGIIAGYAEYSLSQIKGQAPSQGSEDISNSLQIICDEAFRCKDIIGKLLSLARPGEGHRQVVDLARIATDVASAVGGLGDYRDRKLAVVAGEKMNVNAIEGEMKQVVLNLTVNALDAVPAGGEVRIEVGRNNGWVELKVRDNGRGMSSQTLDRVFEPFFTDKRGVRGPGTGLGLSITHAIVESHGGHIKATSSGPGMGSEFVVQLPAVQERSVA